MNSKYFRTINIISIVAIILVAGFFITGCQKEEDEPLDDVILNSSELEEYIIAGVNFKESLDIYKKKLAKIDLSQLEVTTDIDGRKVMRLPEAIIASISIKGKVQFINQKKEELLKKFPQFEFFREEVRKKYFQQCIQHSSKLNSKLLKLGINTSQPRLKNGAECAIEYYDSWNYFMGHLYNTTDIEVIFIGYNDGTYGIISCSDFDDRYSYYSGFYRNNYGNLVYQDNTSKTISWMGHTHLYNSTPTYPEDYNARDTYYGVDHYIFYDGSFYNY